MQSKSNSDASKYLKKELSILFPSEMLSIWISLILGSLRFEEHKSFKSNFCFSSYIYFEIKIVNVKKLILNLLCIYIFFIC